LRNAFTIICAMLRSWELKHQTGLDSWLSDIINFSVFFNKVLFHIFSSGWNWEIRLLSGFVKTFQPVLESQLALLQRKECLSIFG
jgi:hypothetical protein